MGCCAESVVVVFPLMTHCPDSDSSVVDDFKQGHIARVPGLNDQFSLEGACLQMAF